MYKVIDIFAGPGGLGEGFTSFFRADGLPVFEISLSIEKDTYAFETLRLRSFYREFRKMVPEEYYELLRGDISQKDLYSKYPFEALKNPSWT